MKSVRLSDVPSVSAEQMAEVDRAMVEDYRIELLQIMENAGRHLAHLARARFLAGDPRGKRILVLAGGGGNGGGALVAARRLHGWGARVEVFLSVRRERFAGVPARQLEILHRMGVRTHPVDALGRFVGFDAEAGEGARSAEVGRGDDMSAEDLMVDGITGYSLRGAPRGTAAEPICS